MLEMQQQEMQRMQHMYKKGGDNPYDVGYSAENAKHIEGTDSANTLEDKAKKSEGGVSGFMDKAKSFSF
jgi:uncharacterized protein (DUF305 family)